MTQQTPPTPPTPPRRADVEKMVDEGRLDEAIPQLEQLVRARQDDSSLRMFLFQVLAINGQWGRAETHLEVAEDLSEGLTESAELLAAAVRCERERAEVFAGRRLPLMFGEPPDWVGWLASANQMAARGAQAAQGGEGGASGAGAETWQSLLRRAVEAAPVRPATVNGQSAPFLRDADDRLGPVLEAFIDGRYFWVPWVHLAAVAIDAPSHLHDLVWAPATLTAVNGGTVQALIPARYPGSESCGDPDIRLGRKTDWVRRDGEVYYGLGQRLLHGGGADPFALLEVRQIEFPEAREPAGGAGAEGAEVSGV